MTLSRRTALKLGLGAGALPLLGRSPLLADDGTPAAADLPVGEVVRARPLPLTAVRLTGGPLEHAQELDARYLLALEPDRMMAFYRERAGLAPKAEGYGGWDGPGRNLTGHIGGHYLSAVSLMYAATGDARFKERADYIVAELAEVQKAHGDGYLVALEGGRESFDRLARGEIVSASFDLNGQWAPWYTLHKTYAGLRDAYRHAGNRTALEVETAFAAWAERVLSGLGDAQLQHMMNTEFGGMNEVLVDLWVDTGDTRWLDLSWKFEHRAFVQPLQRHQDHLAGKHGNTSVPKLIGSADRFTHTGRPADLMAASFFWDRVVQHHSFSSGGHGRDEYFGPPGELSDRVDGRTAETCNVYNMLKLTRQLFALRPDAHYADFHERALFNHILASIDPEDGRTCYMVPVGRGVTREYQNMERSFTCCVGSGMESHALHGHGIFYEDGDRLWVGLYAPATAEWAEAGLRLAMETGFPEGETATLRLELAAPRELTLALRRPYWAGEGFQVRVNGQVVPEPAVPAGLELSGRSQYEPSSEPASSWVELRRTWRSGDVVEVTLPKSLRLEPLPDNPRRASLMWGPLVLAGDLGPEPERPARGEGDGPREWPTPPTVPVFVAADRPVEEWVQPVAGGPPGRFRTVGAGREPDAGAASHEVELSPFFRLHRRTYSTYWDLYAPAEWEAKKTEYMAEEERLRALEAVTIAHIRPGRDDEAYGFQSGDERAWPAGLLGRSGRRTGTWFSYDLPVEAGQPLALILTHHSDDRRGTPGSFEILVDGRRLADAEVDRSEPPRFFDVRYPIPAEMVEGKPRVTVRFQAKEESQVATIFGIRVVRGNELP
jgi:hypothetical protein